MHKELLVDRRMSPGDRRRGGIIAGLLYSVLAIIVLLVAGGIYLARHVRIHEESGLHGDNVSLDTPAGHLSIRARRNFKPSSLGIPLYPGAERTEDGGGATFSWTSSDGEKEKDMAFGGVDLVTPDSPEQVLQFYRERLPDWAVVSGRHGSRRLELKEGDSKRIIIIYEKGGRTHIGVATVGAPASN